jgi:hypothetical protein
MTRFTIYGLTCFGAILAAMFWRYQDVSRVAMRSAGHALVMVGYYLIGSAG